ncbi:MAG: hypothetical protein WED05_10280 [Candidatus Atabeyarchaeum deiterrae]
MSKKKWALVGFTIGLIAFSGVFSWFMFFRHPWVSPLGVNPAIGLPLYDYSYNNKIAGFGQITPTYYHNGFDFAVNASTTFVAAHEAYVDGIRTWYNDKGGHWQTNVELWINPQWTIEMAFESWALNETYANLQAGQILVSVGEHVMTNQSIGILQHFGDGSHVHFGVGTWGNYICPYDAFTASARATFVTQFYKVNTTTDWRM